MNNNNDLNSQSMTRLSGCLHPCLPQLKSLQLFILRSVILCVQGLRPTIIEGLALYDVNIYNEQSKIFVSFYRLTYSHVVH